MAMLNLKITSGSESDFAVFGETELVRAGVVLSISHTNDFIPNNNVNLPTDIEDGWEIEDSDNVNSPFTNINKLHMEMRSIF